jgi:hypothetical protein
MTTPQSITVDGIGYDVAQFSDEVKGAIGLYNTINLDLQKANIEVVKHQAALQTIGAQVSNAVRKELAAMQPPAEPAKAAE